MEKPTTVYSKERGLRNLKPGASFEDYKAKCPSAVKIKGKPPTIKQLEKWSNAGACPTPCGCRVEPDGSCEHGLDSWLIICGVM